MEHPIKVLPETAEEAEAVARLQLHDLKLTEPNDYLYFCTAMDIQYGGSHIDLYELTLDEIIDFDAFRVICNSVAICLYGLDAVKVAEKRKRYKKKKKGKVTTDERS